jgi:hypothetical protein
MNWLRHKLQGIYVRLIDWLQEHSRCEICHEEQVAHLCIGCGRYICYGCDSMFYEDENLCIECRATITPEEEAEMAREQVDLEAGGEL